MSVEILSAKDNQVVYELRGPEAGQACAAVQSAPMAMVTVPQSAEPVTALRVARR